MEICVGEVAGSLTNLAAVRRPVFRIDGRLRNGDQSKSG
jgi:hypothetical protein